MCDEWAQLGMFAELQHGLIRLCHSELFSLPVSKRQTNTEQHLFSGLAPRLALLFGFCKYLGEEKPDSVLVSRVTPAVLRVRPSRHKHRLHYIFLAHAMQLARSTSSGTYCTLRHFLNYIFPFSGTISSEWKLFEKKLNQQTTNMLLAVLFRTLSV